MLQLDDDEDLDQKKLKMYHGNGYEIHSVLFEGHLGSYESKPNHMVHLKNQMFKVMGQVKEGEIIDAYEWKISDVDMHMYGDRQFS